MKNVTIIYNPRSGNNKGGRYARKIARRLHEAAGLRVNVLRSDTKQSVDDFFASEQEQNISGGIIIIGGDGTVSSVVNAMFKAEKDVPLALFGRGTANDFASYLKTNKSVKKFTELFLKGNYMTSDTLLVNGCIYAINNAGGGAFTNGVSNYSRKLKKIFGKLVYWIKAAFTAFTLKPQSVKINIDGEEFHEKIFLFLAVNSTNIAGIKRLIKPARADDGLVDLFILKQCGILGRLALFISMAAGRILKNKRVVHKQAKEITAELCGDVIRLFSVPDIDGEGLGSFPLHVIVSDKKVRVLSNRT